MNPCQYCFVFIGEGLSPENCFGSFASESFKVNVFGVDTFDNTINLAKHLINSGTNLVDLCGDFNQEIADQIKLASENRAEIRFVSYDAEELTKLENLESDENYGFIIMAEGLSPNKNIIKLLNNTVSIIGVSTVDQACESARQLVEDKVDFIELSSAFDQQKALAIIQSIDGKVPVGYAGK